jgi:hypothetical protein
VDEVEFVDIARDIFHGDGAEGEVIEGRSAKYITY